MSLMWPKRSAISISCLHTHTQLRVVLIHKPRAPRADVLKILPGFSRLWHWTWGHLPSAQANIFHYNKAVGKEINIGADGAIGHGCLSSSPEASEDIYANKHNSDLFLTLCAFPERSTWLCVSSISPSTPMGISVCFHSTCFSGWRTRGVLCQEDWYVPWQGVTSWGRLTCESVTFCWEPAAAPKGSLGARAACHSQELSADVA